jgi:hypothetical protein
MTYASRRQDNLLPAEEGDIRLALNLLTVLAARYRASQKPDESLRLYRRCVAIVEGLGIQGRPAVAAYSHLAWELQNRNELRDALAVSEKECAVASALNDPAVLAETLGRQGTIKVRFCRLSETRAVHSICTFEKSN